MGTNPDHPRVWHGDDRGWVRALAIARRRKMDLLQQMREEHSLSRLMREMTGLDG